MSGYGRVGRPRAGKPRLLAPGVRLGRRMQSDDVPDLLGPGDFEHRAESAGGALEQPGPGGHVPNRMSARLRRLHLLAAAAVTIHVLVGALIDDVYLFIPSKHGIVADAHYHGPTVWILLGAAVAFAASLVSAVIDHYDTRPNERRYHQAATALVVCALCLAVAAALVAGFDGAGSS